MKGYIEFIYLVGFVLLGFILLYIYYRIARIPFAHKWKNLDVYCKQYGYTKTNKEPYQTDYQKEVSREELQKILDNNRIECILPPDLRYFDNISITYTKPNFIQSEFYERHIGGSRIHRFFNIFWLENGRWIKYKLKYNSINYRPYVDSKYGGMLSEESIRPNDSIEEIKEWFDFQIKSALNDFKRCEIQRWERDKSKSESKIQVEISNTV